MKAAQLLILAYRAHKKGLATAAQKIFTQAMNEESAPFMMEALFKQVQAEDNLKEFQNLDIEEQEDEEINLEEQEDGEIEIDELDVEEQEETAAEEIVTPSEEEIEIVELEDNEDEGEEVELIENEDEIVEEDNEALSSLLTNKQIAQLKAIANKLASQKNPKLAKHLLAAILK